MSHGPYLGEWGWRSQAWTTDSRTQVRKLTSCRWALQGRGQPRAGRQEGRGFLSQALASSSLPARIFRCLNPRSLAPALPQVCGEGPMSLTGPKLARRRRAVARGRALGPRALVACDRPRQMATSRASVSSLLKPGQWYRIVRSVSMRQMERSSSGSTCARHTAGSRQES